MNDKHVKSLEKGTIITYTCITGSHDCLSLRRVFIMLGG